MTVSTADTAEPVPLSPLMMATPSIFMDTFTARRVFPASLKMMVGNEHVGSYGKVTYVRNLLIEFNL